jgi:hypothetical protein
MKSEKRVPGIKKSRVPVKGKEVKTLEPWNPVFVLNPIILLLK